MHGRILIRNKESTGRPKDIGDADELRKGKQKIRKSCSVPCAVLEVRLCQFGAIGWLKPPSPEGPFGERVAERSAPNWSAPQEGKSS